jgi:hypothetical protein
VEGILANPFAYSSLSPPENFAAPPPLGYRGQWSCALAFLPVRCGLRLLGISCRFGSFHEYCAFNVQNLTQELYRLPSRLMQIVLKSVYLHARESGLAVFALLGQLRQPFLR